eukprot:scaffold51213_cov55-Phaeocystis_antarctica.AAC.1
MAILTTCSSGISNSWRSCPKTQKPGCVGGTPCRYRSSELPGSISPWFDLMVFEDARDAPSRLKEGLSQSTSPALLARTTARKAPVFTSTKALARSPTRAERSHGSTSLPAIPVTTPVAKTRGTSSTNCGVVTRVCWYHGCGGGGGSGCEQQKRFSTLKQGVHI